MDQQTKQTEKAKFSEKEKLSIIKEAEKNGVTSTLEKYNLYPATFYYWKKKIAESGEDGLKHGVTKEKLLEISRLKAENQKLKEIIAEKELESKLKDELILKKFGPWKTKKL